MGRGKEKSGGVGEKDRTEGLIDDELVGFRTGRGCVDQIFTIKAEW